MMIIGLCGFEGVGKTTTAAVLVNKHGFVELSFAKTLKDITAIAFNYDRNLLEGNTKESREFREQDDIYWSEQIGKQVTPRRLLQDIGMLFRGYSQDFWTVIVQKQIQDLHTKDPNVKIVISDLRFDNEATMIQKLGGHIVKVSRMVHSASADWIPIAMLHLKDPVSHAAPVGIHPSSYTFLGFKYDYYLDNFDDLMQLEENITTMLRNL